MEAAAVKEVRMWSQLPTEILEAIFIKLPILDYTCAGSVCVSWREAAAAARNLRSSSPRTPWLMLSQDPQTNIHSFLSLYDHKVYSLHLPIAHNQEEQYLGSFREWLILRNSSKGKFFLLNIISKARIRLSQNADLYNHASHRMDFTLTLFADLPCEGILSSAPTSDDCIVVLLLDGSALAFCRLGNASTWTIFQPYETGQLGDPLIMSISFYGGCLHCICDGYQHIVCELDVPPKFRIFDTRPSLQIANRDRNRIRRDGMRLVESNSELLLVLKSTSHRLRNYVDDDSKGLGFYVFKMDPSSPTTRWVKVASLGDDGMLFLGDKGSNSFWARGLPGFRGNCIYFVNNLVNYLPSTCDAAAFSLEDCRINTLISKRVSVPLMWFMM